MPQVGAYVAELHIRVMKVVFDWVELGRRESLDSGVFHCKFTEFCGGTKELSTDGLGALVVALLRGVETAVEFIAHEPLGVTTDGQFHFSRRPFTSSASRRGTVPVPGDRENWGVRDDSKTPHADHAHEPGTSTGTAARVQIADGSQIDQIGLRDRYLRDLPHPLPIPSKTPSQLSPPGPSVRFSIARNRVSPTPMVSSSTALKPDHVGIVVLHIYSANDLPKWPNVTRTGWDMDPFVKVSIGEQVKKTDVERHKLDPVWDKELFFHVRQQDLKLPIRLEVFDWDMFTRNDLVGSAEINIATLVERAANRDPNTGLHPADLPSVLYFKGLPLTKSPDPSRVYTRTPTITFQCVPWCYTLPVTSHTPRYGNRRSRDYDTDYTQAISRGEPTSMLKCPGSTPSFETIDSCTRMQTAPLRLKTIGVSFTQIARITPPFHRSDDWASRRPRDTEQRTRWLIDWRCVERCLTDRLVRKAVWTGELSLDWDSASHLTRVVNSSLRLQFTLEDDQATEIVMWHGNFECLQLQDGFQRPSQNCPQPVPVSEPESVPAPVTASVPGPVTTPYLKSECDVSCCAACMSAGDVKSAATSARDLDVHEEAHDVLQPRTVIVGVVFRSDAVVSVGTITELLSQEFLAGVVASDEIDVGS
ncbi:hypothetical protein EDB86DRAFT_3246889 [Lactarius hatsudake]|nr:hypothetical protein EDB86DRAFT_3246889 [Lactarius hatsudake]